MRCCLPVKISQAFVRLFRWCVVRLCGLRGLLLLSPTEEMISISSHEAENLCAEMEFQNLTQVRA